MQLTVSLGAGCLATVRRMAEWRDYWRTVCAPKLKARKDTLGRGVPEREIASYVEARTAFRSGRALVQAWLHGAREPYISQFFALCEKLEVDPVEVLRAPVGKARPMLRRVAEPATPAYRVRKARATRKQ